MGERIKKMPDKQTLEAFMSGMHGEGSQVAFNSEKGEFEWMVERPPKEPPLGQAKTEFGEEMRRL